MPIAIAQSDMPGDTNGDGIVDFPDFLMVTTTYGLEAAYVPTDFDDSGTVDFPDFLTLAGNYGSTFPVAVPEPSSLMSLLMLIAVGDWERRRPKFPPKETKQLTLVFTSDGCENYGGGRL